MSLVECEMEMETPVLDEIKEGARILLIFDYPTGDMVREKKLMAGSVMSLLSMCMSGAKIPLSACSVIFIFPFSNEGKVVSKYWTEKEGFKTGSEIYLEALKEKIEKANATLLVPIGEMALQAVTEKRGIEKWRGSILASSFNSLKTIPTLHPRECFKRFLLRYFIASDFKKIAVQQKFKEINLPKRELKINPTFEEVIEYLDRILKNKLPVSSDIECPIPKVVKNPDTGEVKIYGLKSVSCISLGISSFYVMSIPFNNFVWSEDQEVEIWIRLAEIYESPEIPTIWQNGACFDIVYLFLVHSCLVSCNNISDTLIKTNILYPEFPKSLAFLTSTRTDEPFYKDDGKEVKVDGTRDWNQYYIYNAKDSAVDFEINTSLDEELEKENKHIWEFSQRLIEPLFYMQCRGIKVNQEKLNEHKKEAKEALKNLENKLRELVGFSLNCNSSKQLIQYFYETKGYKKITKTVKDSKTGERKETITVDTKALTKIARIYDDETARLIKQIRGAKKLISTYLEIPFDSDGRLRGSFKQSTKFLRLASSKTPFKTGMNQQNLPKIFMEFLEADEGFIAFELDKKQAEWVDCAYYFNDSNMIKIVESGDDIHVATAMMMFKTPKELVEKENEILGSLTEPVEILYKRQTYLPEILNYPVLPNMSARQSGKKCNHSFDYGLSAAGYASNYDMPMTIANTCYNLYHKTAYPGILKAHERIRNKLVTDRTLVNPFGWIRRFLGRLDDNTFRQGYAFHGQSTVGMMLNFGLNDTYYQQYDPEKKEYMYPIDIFTQVHDSMKGQYPCKTDDDLRRFAKALIQMKDNLDIPLKEHGREYVIKTDAKIGFNLKKMLEVPLYSDEETLYLAIKKAIEELRPTIKELPPIEEQIEEALEQEEEDEIMERIQKDEEDYYIK